MRKDALITTVFLISVVAQTWSLSGKEDGDLGKTPKIRITTVNDEYPARASEANNQGKHPSDGDFLAKFEKQNDDIEQNLGTVNNHPNTKPQQTKYVENTLEADDKNNKQFPCPEYSAITPCECSYDESDNLYMNCTDVESEEQLVSVFQAEFPFKTFKSFYMGPNAGIKFFGDIFNDVTFEEVEVVRATNLELVSQYWLYGSRDTLRYLAITHSKLHSETFPFISMDAYTKLETLYITYANLTMVPPLHSETLTSVAFEASNIVTASKEMFQNATSLTYINLGDNNITAIQADTFRLVDAPSTIYLYQNFIESIEAGAFVLPSNPRELSLNLHVGVNKLITLDEEVFGEVFPYVTTFDVFGNPLECGCDVAWLLTDEENMAKVDNWAQCADGTNLHDLDPSPYEDLC